MNNCQEIKKSPLVLDPCCGGRMMWFDKKDQRTLFGDIREESHILCDGRVIEIKPDLKMDFTAMPFQDNTFKLVVFDPPHLIRVGINSWMFKKYGILGKQWEEDLSKGFSECFRVLKNEGVLIFKWSETQIKIKEVLELTPHKPLFGHTTKNNGMTHWYTFMKE